MFQTHQDAGLYPLNENPDAPVKTTLCGENGLLIATIKVGSFNIDALSLIIGAKYETSDGKPFYQPITLDGFYPLSAATETTITRTFDALPQSDARFVGYRTLKSEGTFGNGLGKFQDVQREVLQINEPYPHMMIDANQAAVYASSPLMAVIPAPVRKFLGNHFGFGQKSPKWLYPQKRF